MSEHQTHHRSHNSEYKKHECRSGTFSRTKQEVKHFPAVSHNRFTHFIYHKSTKRKSDRNREESKSEESFYPSTQPPQTLHGAFTSQRLICITSVFSSVYLIIIYFEKVNPDCIFVSSLWPYTYSLSFTLSTISHFFIIFMESRWPMIT